MMVLARIAGLVLAAVFGLAAVAKARRPAETEREISELGLVAPRLLSRAIPVVELTVAAMLVVIPPWGGMAAFALLAAFTTVLVGVIRSGRVVSCACFGGASDQPVGHRTLLRNAVLMALALAAASL